MESPHQEFDAWLRWVFDHPVPDPAWYWNENVVAPPLLQLASTI